jgi:hypothetical protein
VSRAACAFLRAARFGWIARIAAALSMQLTNSRWARATSSPSPSAAAVSSRLYSVFAAER